MRTKKSSIGFTLVLAMVNMTLLVTSTGAGAQTETVLHNFKDNGRDGFYPRAGLVFSAAGKLYGTTNNGGAHGFGTVYELAPGAGGGSAERVLHSFASGQDGQTPEAGLIFDSAGNFYGTTFYGSPSGRGTVFEFSPQVGGGWSEKILRDFGNNNGQYPIAALVLDGAGNLYGSTFSGAYESGTLFELTPTARGLWAQTELYDFVGTPDGGEPFGSLIFDAHGNLYGTTSAGGIYGAGTVFELKPETGGGWSEKDLYSFGADATDGLGPEGGLTFDAAGNLYGTTIAGGTSSCSCGTAFKLAPTANGKWIETVLHSFGDGTDGAQPYADLIFDAAGNLYGTTVYGGSGTCTATHPGCGTVFELTPASNATWTETLLHSFKNDGKDGTEPYSNLILDAAGNLYGTTSTGGAYNCGTVFEITP